MPSLTRDEILAVLRSAPPKGEARLEFFGSHFNQMFGWITGPDRYFLCDWLPDVALGRAAPMRLVEVGTFAGSTARGLIGLSGGGTITCIDDMSDVHAGARGPYPSGRAFWEATLRQGVDFSAYATLIEGDSREVGPRWVESVDLAFIDGKHDYPYASADIRNFCPHVVVGGYALVDDYDMPDVARACGEFFDSRWRLVRSPIEPTAKIICYERIGS